MSASAALDSSVTESDESFAVPTALPDSVETPAATPPPQEKPKGEAPAQDEKPDTGTDATAKRNDPQKRIDRLTRKLRDAEREAAYERGRREALEQTQKPAAAQEPQRPKLDDFDTAEEFAEALADWKLTERGRPKASDESKDSRPTPRESADKAETPKPSDVAVKSYIDAKAKYSDLDDVLFDTGLPWSVHMANAVADLENSAEILYHLGQDEDELERIAKLSPKQQEREVWRFAEKLSSKLSDAKPPAQQDTDADSESDEPQAKQQPGATVTKAQPVPRTLSGSTAAGKSIEDMSEAEYMAYMNEQERKGGRRSY